MAKITSKPVKKKAKAPAKKAAPRAPVPARGAELIEPIAALRRDMDRLFEDFTRSFSSMFHLDPFRHLAPTFEFMRGEMVPDVEVSEDDKSYKITAELPGIDENEVNLTLRDGVLTLSGEKKAEREEKEEEYHFSERSYGSFRRSFRVPEDVDADKVGATFDKGVMVISLPKLPTAKTKGRSIPIK